MVFLPAAKNTLPPSRVAYVRAVIRYTEIGRDGNCRYCLVLYFHPRADFRKLATQTHRLH